MPRTMISQGSVGSSPKMTIDRMSDAIKKSASLGHALQLIAGWVTLGYVVDPDDERSLIELAEEKHK